MVARDFFRSARSGGDLYPLKNILHDWDDAKSREILAAIRRATPKVGKLLLIEGIVCAPNQPCSGKSYGHHDDGAEWRAESDRGRISTCCGQRASR